MSRATNDPRIVEVLTAFHRHVQCAHKCAAQFSEEFVYAILGNGYSHEGVFSGFPTEGLLALLTTYLQHTPEDDLNASVAVARAQLAALFDFEHTAAIEDGGEIFASDFDYPARLEQEMTRISEGVQ